MTDDLKRVGLIFKEEGAVDFRKTLQDINIEMNKNYNQFKLTQSQWDKSTKSTEKLKAQQEYLGNAIEIQGDKVNVLRRQLEELENAENKDITAIKKKQNELTNAEIKLKNYENQLKDVTGQLNNSGKAWEENGKKVEKFGKSIEEAGKKVAGLSTVATAGLAGTVAIAANFEDSMRQVAATMGITAEEISNGSEAYTILENAAKECGEKTKYSASEAAEALNYLALAGYDAQKSAETLPKILNLAAAGNLDLATASDMVTDAMSALSMETKDVDKYIDEMAKTSQKSNTSVAQLGEATLTCAGNVKNAHMSIETMNAELGILADNGLKGAEGGTALRNIIVSLTSPTDKAAETLKKLGVNVYDNKGNIRDFNDILTDLNSKLNKLNDEKRSNALSDIFNKNDLKAAQYLLDGTTGRFQELTNELKNSNGAAQDMADTMNSSLKGQLTLVKSQLEGIAIKLGNKLMPIVKDCVNKISDLATWFSNLNDKQAETVLLITGIVAAAGPLLTIVGKLTSSIGGTIKAIGTARQAIGVMKGTITSTSTAVSGLVNIFSTITPVVAVAAIGAVTNALLEFETKEEEVSKKTEESRDSLEKQTDSWNKLTEAAKEYISNNSTEIIELQNLRDELSKITDENGKVKAGYENRAKFITDKLEEATGKEIELNDGVIQSYEEIQKAIDDTIRKKEAELLLSAYQNNYAAALKERAAAVQNLANLQDELNQKLDKQKEIKDKLDKQKIPSSDLLESYSKVSEEIDKLNGDIANANQKVSEYGYTILSYSDLEAATASGNAEKIDEALRKINASYDDAKKVAEQSYQEQASSTSKYVSTLKELLQDAQNASDTYREIEIQNELTAQETKLKNLGTSLIEQTNVVNENAPEIVNAWKELATNSYNTYYDTISPLDETLRVKIEQMTGVTAEKTPELVAETQKMSEQVLDQIEKNSEFRQEAINNLKGMLNGLEDNELRELLNNAGVENVDKVIKGIRKGNLAEDEGVNILKSLHNGLSSASWQKSLWDTARGIASTLSGLLTVKASVNGKKSALPGHKSGLDFVPYDDYVTRLHKGERVLTAKENKSLEEAQRISRKSNLEFSISSNHANMIDIDYNKIANAFLTALNKCKLTLDEDGFARIVKDELYKVV